MTSEGKRDSGGTPLQRSRCAILVNGQRVDDDYLLQDGDIVSVVPTSGRQAAPMPRIRLFRKHLQKTFGMSPAAHHQPSGRGDHEKWYHPNGWSIDVNPRRGDRKEVDQACVADLARKLGEPFGKILQKTMSRA